MGSTLCKYYSPKGERCPVWSAAIPSPLCFFLIGTEFGVGVCWVAGPAACQCCLPRGGGWQADRYCRKGHGEHDFWLSLLPCLPAGHPIRDGPAALPRPPTPCQQSTQPRRQLALLPVPPRPSPKSVTVSEFQRKPEGSAIHVCPIFLANANGVYDTALPGCTPSVSVLQGRENRVQLLHRPGKLRNGVRCQLLRLGQVVGVRVAPGKA